MIGARTFVDVMLCRSRRKKILARPALGRDDCPSFDIVQTSTEIQFPSYAISGTRHSVFRTHSASTRVSPTNWNPHRRTRVPRHLRFSASPLTTAHLLYKSKSN